MCVCGNISINCRTITRCQLSFITADHLQFLIVRTLSNGIVLGEKGNAVFLQWHSHQMSYGIFTIKILIFMFGDRMESNKSGNVNRSNLLDLF